LRPFTNGGCLVHRSLRSVDEADIRAGSEAGRDRSEASVYRLLKAQDLITGPADIVIKAADEFRDKTTASNQLWQTDFTYLMVIGWGWYALSTVLDDFSRYIVVWKLCATMQASDVAATLDRALAAAGLDHVHVVSGLGGSPTTGRATSRGISPTGSAAGA
jgi:transposase InsO family protein